MLYQEISGNPDQKSVCKAKNVPNVVLSLPKKVSLAKLKKTRAN
jgi:hypothetical protein